jgi:hypothetical protein
MRSLVAAVVAVYLMLAVAPAWADGYAAYRHEVRRLTERTYRRHRAAIDPGRMRGRRAGVDLDHYPTSIRQCYIRHVPAATCASQDNLRMLDSRRNRAEGCRAVGCRRAPRRR